jgi:hypothetical protein
MRRAAALSFVLISGPLSLAAPQSPIGRLEGSVNDSHGRTVANASVELTRADAETVATFHATADAAGRYHFDSLAAGEYAIRISTPLLDSLELALPERAVRVAAGQASRADFTIPRGATLRDAVCPGLALGTGKGVVAGRAIDADTEQPLAGATVAVTWTELAVTQATLQSRNEERTAAVQTGPRGDYRLCGVPSDTKLTLQLQHTGHVGTAISLTVAEEDGAVARDLSLSPRSAPTIAALDSADRVTDAAASDTTADELLLTGTAALTGMVRGSTGQPLPSTELRVRGARSTAISDAGGRFALAELPAGSQALLARHLGYEPTEVAVELRAGRTVQRDVRLTRVVSLDAVRAVAMRSQYPEFEYNRRANPFGRYLGPDDVARRHPTQATDLFFGVPGLTVVGQGHAAAVRSTRRRTGSRGCAGVRVIVDRLEGVDLNDVPASAIAAVEIYSDGAMAPSQYAVRGSCGVIVVWTKAQRRIQAPTPPGANTAP